MTFYADEFWQAFEDAGMLVECTFAPRGCTELKTVMVAWREPDNELMNGSRSKDFEIEYRVADMPDLTEGDLLSIEEPNALGKADYRVRADPTVNVESGDDGTYKCALLTRERARS